MSGRKTVEVRTWTDRFRGPLWIHASTTPDEAAQGRFGLTKSLPYGALVGRVDLIDIVPFDARRWSLWRDLHLSDGPAPFGAFGFVLEHARRLSSPEPLRGQLKLFSLPPEIDTAALSTRLEA